MAADGPGGPHGLLQVHIPSLTKLAALLRDQVNSSFDPRAAQVIQVLDPGQDIGSRPGIAEWETTRAEYLAGRARQIELLGRFQAAMLRIAEAADVIGRRYRESDQFASATLVDVQQALAEASVKYGPGIGG